MWRPFGAARQRPRAHQNGSNPRSVRNPRSARKAGAAAVAVADERTSRMVTIFFESQLKPFLMSRHIQKHVLSNPAQAAPLFQQLRVLVPQSLWPKFDDLENICEEEHQLSRQIHIYRWLHGWLLVHVPLSIALLVLGGVHAVMALRY